MGYESLDMLMEQKPSEISRVGLAMTEELRQAQAQAQAQEEEYERAEAE